MYDSTSKPASKKTAKKPAKAPSTKVAARKAHNPAALTGGSYTGEKVNADDKARAFRDYTTAVENGFTFSKGLAYALGEPVNMVGQENLRRSRIEFDERPQLDDVVAQGRAVIAAEERQDETAPMHELGMMPDGRLCRAGAPLGSALGATGTALTPNAFASLVSRGGFPARAAEYLAGCKPELRAVNVNAHLPGCLTPKQAPRTLKVRSRKAGDAREIYAVMSDLNRKFDADEVLGLVGSMAQAGARASFTYDGSRWELKVYYHTDINPEQAVAGEIFKAGIVVWGSDDGQHGLHVAAFVERNLCKNLIILEEATQDAWTTHIRKNLAEVVTGMVTEALDKVGAFAEGWNAARVERIAEGIYGSYEAKHIFEAICAQGLVKLPGVDREEMVNRLVRAWEKEPGWTRADIVNAVTRAAHEEAWSSPWATSSLEQQGGELLYAKVYVNQCEAPAAA